MVKVVLSTYEDPPPVPVDDVARTRHAEISDFVIEWSWPREERPSVGRETELRRRGRRNPALHNKIRLAVRGGDSACVI